MKTYIFRTTTTMKEYNSKHWWIDGKIITEKVIAAENLTAAGVDTLVGAEHKATYKAVTSSRVDTTALKKDMPDVAARYTKTTETRRFTFA